MELGSLPVFILCLYALSATTVQGATQQRANYRDVQHALRAVVSRHRRQLIQWPQFLDQDVANYRPQYPPQQHPYYREFGRIQPDSGIYADDGSYSLKGAQNQPYGDSRSRMPWRSGFFRNSPPGKGIGKLHASSRPPIGDGNAAKVESGTNEKKLVSQKELEALLFGSESNMKGGRPEASSPKPENRQDKPFKQNKGFTNKADPKMASKEQSKEVVPPRATRHELSSPKTLVRKRSGVTLPPRRTDDDLDCEDQKKRLQFQVKLEKLKAKLLRAEVNELLGALDYSTRDRFDINRDTVADETGQLQNALSLELLQDKISKISLTPEQSEDGSVADDGTDDGSDTFPLDQKRASFGKIWERNDPQDNAKSGNREQIDLLQRWKLLTQKNSQRKGCPAIDRHAAHCRLTVSEDVGLDDEATDLCKRHQLCYACAASNRESKEDCDSYVSEAVVDCGDDKNCKMGVELLLQLMREEHAYNPYTDPTGMCQQPCVRQFVTGR